ncbi:hypothetical protein HETIRDRAFT_437462 [Heterobasidion irregulare TC 32-1]|uniref:Hydrophobin n=1 Tax=Heterobasidion irregulare (strain TC 32-1) TaxID=747525 RepID=W4KL44_HETIT|nr:uncharacterized protein HETIRDRAFT_437462 [Heterobasidion irregulare TC 32-1]ETW86573.1 hypothetical protein HETIRDRAFT_437462 [Heterobasidion irregulare TC 32-1]
MEGASITLLLLLLLLWPPEPLEGRNVEYNHSLRCIKTHICCRTSSSVIWNLSRDLLLPILIPASAQTSNLPSLRR